MSKRFDSRKLVYVDFVQIHNGAVADLSPEQLQEALNYQKANGGKLGFNLVKLGFVKDDGKGFSAERMLHAKKRKRLGLLGMRERVEMVNGNFAIESAPGKGTTIQAQIPLANDTDRGGE